MNYDINTDSQIFLRATFSVSLFNSFNSSHPTLFFSLAVASAPQTKLVKAKVIFYFFKQAIAIISSFIKYLKLTICLIHFEYITSIQKVWP